MKALRITVAVLAIAVLGLAVVALATGCGGSSQPASSTSSAGPLTGTLTVWDYYGSATPIKPAVAAFQKLHPGLKINFQAVDYDTFQQKFAVTVSSGAPPDVATIDMTWIPTFASQRAARRPHASSRAAS